MLIVMNNQYISELAHRSIQKRCRVYAHKISIHSSSSVKTNNDRCSCIKYVNRVSFPPIKAAGNISQHCLDVGVCFVKRCTVRFNNSKLCMGTIIFTL